MAPEWPFADPPNVAVFTLRRILQQNLPILMVCHDEEDGGWQFLDGEPMGSEDAILCSLKTVVSHDPSIAPLADLPPGWQATRSGPGEPWTRSPQPESEE